MVNEKELRREIYSLLDNSKYNEAKEVILSALAELNKADDAYGICLATIAGLSIDLGTEGYDKESAELGIKILNENESFFKTFLSLQSFNYNMANGMHGLYKIQNRGNGLPILAMIKPNLAGAKNYYFKAYKEIEFEEIDDIDLQILTNLGNSLSQSGRIVEAIRLYNSVLKISPNFPQALVGLAEGLDYWIGVSFSSRTIALYQTVYTLFEQGLMGRNLPIIKNIYYQEQLEKYRALIEKHGFGPSQIEKEMKLNDDEYKKHSAFRRYCIDNFLTLNEHSLYCKCSQAGLDDLSILEPSVSLYGDKIGKMELLLNRLKSEFSLSRKLYYEGLHLNNDYGDVSYSELMDGEIIGEQIEKIRASFRLCFGVFDKIAHGVIYFFDLPKKNAENIYFESFWNTPKCHERWEKLKEMRNPHLAALYSISNDFNSKEGEFHFYKQWRNKLEHNNLILVDKIDEPSLFKLFDDDAFVSNAAYPFFIEQGLHLLQICCASIYSYVYAIRTEGMQRKEDSLTTPIIVHPKVMY